MSEGAGLPLVDTHHHLWDLDQFRYDWLCPAGDDEVTAYLGDYRAIRANYLIDELLAEYQSAGISKSVHVEANISQAQRAAETVWLQKVAETHGFPHAIIAYGDPREPSIGAQLDAHCAAPKMRGIRAPDVDGLLTSPATERGIREVAARGLSFQVDTPLERMPELAQLAQRFPSTIFFLGHAGVPDERGDDYFRRWRAAIRSIAATDNVIVKISGLGMRDRRWTTDSIRRWVLEAIEAFGTARCVFGTNWPVDRLYSDLRTLVEAYREIISQATRDEQEALMFRNAERLYSI